MTTETTEYLVRRLIQTTGEDPDREGLRETPKRFMRAWGELTSGYERDPQEILKTFADGAEGCDQMVVVRRVPFWSLCEHHLAPFFGDADIAYIPADRVVGLSKLVRLLDCYARRLQVQERLTNQIADALQHVLAPKGVGVRIRARHLCMEMRGVNRPGCETVTSALRGVMLDKGEARSEFFSLAKD